MDTHSYVSIRMHSQALEGKFMLGDGPVTHVCSCTWNCEEVNRNTLYMYSNTQTPAYTRKDMDYGSGTIAYVSSIELHSPREHMRLFLKIHIYQ